MKRNLVSAAVLLSLSLVTLCPRLGANGFHSANPAVAGSKTEDKILSVLDRMVKSHQTYLSVPPEDGKALRLLTEAIGAKNVIEIGTSTGYSGLWFCLALQATGGHLTTFEINHERASQAREHFKEAGVEEMVTVIEGDAHEQLAKLKGPIDVAFIDADKGGYVDYLNKLLPRVQRGGLILAHNVDMVPDYVRAVTTSADMETIFYRDGAGLAVTLKRR